MNGSVPVKSQRLDLILRQIDSLPTLPSVATRLLLLTADDRSDTREIIELIRSDQSLTANVLALCRTAEKGLRQDVITLDRAVVLLGFNTVRSAVLSVQVFDALRGKSDAAASGSSPPSAGAGAAEESQAAVFDLMALWQHCLAVAIAAQLLAEAHPKCGLSAGEAFVCGLLHDIGKVALNRVLPKCYGRVVELADLNQSNIAEYERRIVGVDHHTAGKRLAEQWQLPQLLVDCIWLHGTPYHMLPQVEHQRMIGLVSLADLVVRRFHIGYSGNASNSDPTELAQALGFEMRSVDGIRNVLYQEMELRLSALGLFDEPQHEVYLSSIERANAALGRLNRVMASRSRQAVHQGQQLAAIEAFHRCIQPGSSVPDVLDAIGASAAELVRSSSFALLHQDSSDHQSVLLGEYDPSGRPGEKQWIDVPRSAPHLAGLTTLSDESIDLATVLPWLAEHFSQATCLRGGRVLTLPCYWGMAGALIHDDSDPSTGRLRALAATWGNAIASAVQYEAARRLGEQLAGANRELAEAQDRLLKSKSMARLGELAAGAAHEMNNPLAVISGRSQLLTMRLAPDSEEHGASQTIVQQAQKLSDLITSLRMFADPPQANRRPVDVADLINETVERACRDLGPKAQRVSFDVKFEDRVETFSIDPEQIRQALTELLFNAVQAQSTSVQISADIRGNNQLALLVEDDGNGMDDHTLAHAADPFFSAKKAGRGVGMGLARAEQWMAAHSGRLELRSQVGRGTLVVMVIPASTDAEGAGPRPQTSQPVVVST